MVRPPSWNSANHINNKGNDDDEDSKKPSEWPNLNANEWNCREPSFLSRSLQFNILQKKKNENIFFLSASTKRAEPSQSNKQTVPPLRISNAPEARFNSECGIRNRFELELAKLDAHSLHAFALHLHRQTIESKIHFEQSLKWLGNSLVFISVFNGGYCQHETCDKQHSFCSNARRLEATRVSRTTQIDWPMQINEMKWISWVTFAHKEN